MVIFRFNRYIIGVYNILVFFYCHFFAFFVIGLIGYKVLFRVVGNYAPSGFWFFIFLEEATGEAGLSLETVAEDTCPERMYAVDAEALMLLRIGTVVGSDRGCRR